MNLGLFLQWVCQGTARFRNSLGNSGVCQTPKGSPGAADQDVVLHPAGTWSTQRVPPCHPAHPSLSHSASVAVTWRIPPCHPARPSLSPGTSLPVTRHLLSCWLWDSPWEGCGEAPVAKQESTGTEQNGHSGEGLSTRPVLSRHSQWCHGAEQGLCSCSGVPSFPDCCECLSFQGAVRVRTRWCCAWGQGPQNQQLRPLSPLGSA